MAQLDDLHFAMLQALPGQTTPEGVPAFKLVLVGDGGTGTSHLWTCRCLLFPTYHQLHKRVVIPDGCKTILCCLQGRQHL